MLSQRCGQTGPAFERAAFINGTIKPSAWFGAIVIGGRERPTFGRSMPCSSMIPTTAEHDRARRAAKARVTGVVFDLGGVLIDWDPRHLYRKLFLNDEPGMERFLAEVCTLEWNAAQDAGRSWAEGTALLRARHPDRAELIDAYHLRWPEMLGGPIEGSVAILRQL